MTENELVKYKRSTVGFVWQNNARNLLPYLTAWENVMTPMLLWKKKKRQFLRRKKEKGTGTSGTGRSWTQKGQ